MVYDKKTWVDVPDPKNYTGTTPLSDLPRFDAKNMNRIEEGINAVSEKVPTYDAHISNKSNPHNITPSQIGALSKTISNTSKDVLEIKDDGWYYCYSAVNVPTEVKNGYLKVCVATSKYKLVCWRPANSHTEYVNILSDGVWSGWSETFTNKGGVVKGNVEINKNDFPYITLRTNKGLVQVLKNANDSFDGGAIIKDCSDTTNSSSYIAFNIKHANPKESSLFLTYAKDGTVNYYNTFGEHNKPTGSYAGTYNIVSSSSNDKRTVSIGGIGSVLLVMSNSAPYIVTPGGAFYKDNHNAFFTSDTKFKNGTLYLTGSTANMEGSIYTYQVL